MKKLLTIVFMLHIAIYNHCSNAMVGKQHALPTLPRSDAMLPKEAKPKLSKAEIKRQEFVEYVASQAERLILSYHFNDKNIRHEVDRFAREMQDLSGYTGHFYIALEVALDWLKNKRPLFFKGYLMICYPDLQLNDLDGLPKDIVEERRNLENPHYRKNAWLLWEKRLSKNESPVFHISAADKMGFPRVTISR